MRTEALIISALRVASWRERIAHDRFIRSAPQTMSFLMEPISPLMEIQIQRLIHGSVASTLVGPVAHPIARHEANQVNVLRPIMEVFEKNYLSFERL